MAISLTPAAAERVKTFSPVGEGETLPRFNFDISYNWYPLAYERPGPRIDVYRLNTGACAPAAAGTTEN